MMHTQNSLSFTYIEFQKITIATSIINNVTGFILYDGTPLPFTLLRLWAP